MAETAAEREQPDPETAEDARFEENASAARDMLVQAGLSSPRHIGLL